MRLILLLILLCLVITGSATAILSPRLGTTFSLKELPDISCSSDTFADSPGTPIIWVVYLNGYGDTFIDGQGKMPMWADTLGGKPGFQYPVSTGMHSVVVFKPGYTNYTAKVQVCNGTVSYVYYDQVSHAITTATTTVPATTASVAPAITTLVTETATTQVTASSTSAPPLSQETVSGSSQNDPGTLSIATTPAGAFIFIDGVQRGVSPATIPGLSPGTHTLLLKLDGYQDLSTPVTITAGKTQEYSSALPPVSAAAAATTSDATGAKKTTAPGFEAIIGITALATVLWVQKTRS
jgi:hypothetical protein